MTHRYTLLVVAVAVAMLVSPTIMAQETATAPRNATNESGETAGMGAQVTAFTQSSSAAVNDSVENGMWRAGFNQSNASERARLVRNRTGALEARLDRLQRQNESLRERYENGSLPEAAYIAQQSRLSARIDGLRTAINDTGEAAARAGVNASRLDRLRNNASNLTGPEVAAIARGLGGGPPENRGPPADRGPPANRTDAGPSAGNGPSDRGPPSNGSDRGPLSNQTDVGPPADNGTSQGGQSGNRTDAGDSGQSGTAGGGNGPDSTGSSPGGSGGGADGTAGGSDGGQRADEAPGRSGS